MDSNTNITILPEDRIQLTQDQKNLIELALIKQLPVKDTEYIEKIQKEAKEDKNNIDPFSKLSEYFTAKYGLDFGMIFLSAIMGGKEKYLETVESIERLKALDRIEKSKQN